MKVRRSLLIGMLLPVAASTAGGQSAARTTARPSPPRKFSADLIIHNARIYTVDEGRPRADALAVYRGRIVCVGSERGAMALRGRNTRVRDLEGATVVPGLTDAHAHLQGLGAALRNVDLVATTSYDEIIARVAERAKQVPAGTWIIGRGWDQNDWAQTAFPTHDALSRAVPDHPVYLTRIDGHAALVNAAAMRAATLTSATTDPSGGRIERAADGSPTGVLVDNAMALVGRAIPDASDAELRAQILAAIAEAHRWGLTGIHDAGVGRRSLAMYRQIAAEGKYTLRNYVMVRGDSAMIMELTARGPQNALYNGSLWIRAIKISIDGALGSRGAALLEPYSDDPGNRGLILVPPERARAVAVRALRTGFQLNIHAIGDRGNRVVLDLFESALEEVPVADHRFRIEHAQILHPDDVPRFAKLDVIPSMQTVHQTSDMYWAGRRIGPEREKGAYAWRQLLETGVIIPNGSDFPVEAVNPIDGFAAAVSRQDAKGFPDGGWHRDQVMSREEALKSFTIWPAYAGFQERDLGSLSSGKYADFVVLDADIMRVPADRIRATRVLATYVGGRAVYESEAATR